jgi:peptidoglycan L-alanyl-D-glutamate endopeptidase CwlK
MTPEQRTARTLATVDSELAARVRMVLDAMAALGHPMVATDGRRTLAQQQALYAQGRTVPGKIVTHLDGVTKRSKHQDGRAVDCCFWAPDGAHWRPVYVGMWEAYMACGEAVGLTAGGRWRMRDYPHLELP